MRKENVFDNILERKKLFYTIKNKRLKSPNIGIFPKGLLHGFGQKFENFPSFLIIGKISRQNVFDDILERKKSVFRFQNKKVKKVEELGFFQRGYSLWFRSKIGNISMFYFCQNQTGKCVWRYSRKEKKLF